MGEENILKKIQRDAEEKAATILKEYEKKYKEKKKVYDEVLANKEEELKKHRESIKTRMLQEIKAKVNLEAKQKITAVKYQIVQDVIREAVDKFLNSKDYVDSVNQLIKNFKTKEVDIYLRKEDMDKITINAPNIKPLNTIKGGVIIKKGKIIHNFSIDAALEVLKEDLLYEVGKRLFGNLK